MNKLFLLFLVVLCAVGVGFLVHQAPGFAMISYDHWVISTSVWTALGCVILAFFVFYFIIRIIKNIFSIPQWFANRKVRVDAEKYRQYLSQSIMSIAIGDYKKAEKTALKAGTHYDTAYANYLIAAQAAQAQQAFERRDNYLKEALESGKSEKFAILLTQAQFMLQANQYDDAILILKSLYKQEPKNPLVLNALKVIYLKNKDVESLKLILPQLKKQGLIAKDELHES